MARHRGQAEDVVSRADDIDEITPDEECHIGGAEYVRRKLEARYRMASSAFVVAVGSGVAIIALGIFRTGAAERIDHMGTFLSVFFGALFSFVGVYMGLGTYELRNNVVGEASPYGSRYSRGVRRGYGGRGEPNDRPYPQGRSTGTGEAGLDDGGEDAGDDRSGR